MSQIHPPELHQNAYFEHYNRNVPHQWLDRYLIESIDEVQDIETP
ncbi:hypothetical protein [Devosia sp. MC532]|nr:hypothetical protein [Devosia sp. MC532]